MRRKNNSWEHKLCKKEMCADLQISAMTQILQASARFYVGTEVLRSVSFFSAGFFSCFFNSVSRCNSSQVSPRALAKWSSTENKQKKE